MKKNTLYLFILLLITGLNTSCNYLDIVPDETATEKECLCQSPCRTTIFIFLLRISSSVKQSRDMYGLYR